ncbi:MAG: inositol monophosphatase family protein [bacterium]
MLPDLHAIENLVRQVAQKEILPRFQHTDCMFKHDGSALTEADLATDQQIQQGLAQLYPEIAFLSEEMEREQQEQLLLNADRLWCLDPLDGTSNFAAGLPLFATSLALFEKGKVVMGITYDPIRDELFSAVKDQGAWLNGKPLRCQNTHFALKKSVAIIDFKRLSPNLQYHLLNKRPYGSQRNIGSCVLEWAWMAANRGHLYLHGGMKLWDLAAGSLILSEAGGYSATLTGESVFVPAMQARSVVASPDEQLFNAWLDYLQQHQ